VIDERELKWTTFRLQDGTMRHRLFAGPDPTPYYIDNYATNPDHGRRGAKEPLVVLWRADEEIWSGSSVSEARGVAVGHLLEGEGKSC
jgi:hypothetical protein